MKQTILSAKGLCKSFAHNGGQIHVLSNVDLELYKIFYYVAYYQNITLAAKALFLTQPTVSHYILNLEKELKEEYNDYKDIAQKIEKIYPKLKIGKYIFVYGSITFTNTNLYLTPQELVL